MKKCTECNKPRLLVSQHVLPGQTQRKLSLSLKDMNDFCCQRDMSDILTQTMKNKKLILEPRACTDPVWALYYRSKKFTPVCAWCGDDLDDANVKRLLKAQETSGDNVQHSTVLYMINDFITFEDDCLKSLSSDTPQYFSGIPKKYNQKLSLTWWKYGLFVTL